MTKAAVFTEREGFPTIVPEATLRWTPVMLASKSKLTEPLSWTGRSGIMPAVWTNRYVARLTAGSRGARKLTERNCGPALSKVERRANSGGGGRAEFNKCKGVRAVA